MTGTPAGTPANALSGKRVVNTRAAHQAGALDALLYARGAIPLAYPCIAIAPPDDPALLDSALSDLAAGHYDWLILTSANTVAALVQRLARTELSLEGAAFRTAAVGPATTATARQSLNLDIADLPAAYIAESLAECLPVTSGTRVLLPESALARPTLADMLRARGAEVTVVTAYQTVCGRGGVDVPRLLALGQIDALTFTSSSTVTCFLERLSDAGASPEQARPVCAACIGPKTAETARGCGFTTRVVAPEHTLEGLVAALETYFDR